MVDLSEDFKLYQQEVPVKGRAVFAGTAIPAGRLVLKFEGPVFTKETCPDFSEAIQIGINAWMWSSGGLDDLVNHSCNPNVALFPVGDGLYLLSARPIAAGEELTFDYSTSMVDEPWGMHCACGEAACRGHIGNFLDMPPAVQDAFAAAGTLPMHVVQAYLTRGNGKARGLTALPLDGASPAAPLFHLAAYSDGTGKDDAPSSAGLSAGGASTGAGGDGAADCAPEPVADAVPAVAVAIGGTGSEP